MPSGGGPDSFPPTKKKKTSIFNTHQLVLYDLPQRGPLTTYELRNSAAAAGSGRKNNSVEACTAAGLPGTADWTARRVACCVLLPTLPVLCVLAA